MLHELLFALSGIPGDVFVQTSTISNSSATFSIPTDFPLLHPTERDSLNRFGHLGYACSQIKSFISSTKDLNTLKKSQQNQPHGAYVQSLVSSLENTINEYQYDLLEIEKSILNKNYEAGSGVVPISLIAAKLNRWELILPPLWKFIQLLQNNPEEYHGCRLFNLLIDQVRTGVLDYRKEMERIIEGLHDVLYRQLTSWMVYGHCVDRYNEFFIAPFSKADSMSTIGWCRLFTIDHSKIPDHLPLPAIESILFVGKAIATINDIEKMSSSVSLNSQAEDSTAKSNSLWAVTQTKISIPEEMRKKHLDLLKALHSSKLQLVSSLWTQYPQLLQNIVTQVRRSTSDWLFSQVLIGDHGLHCYLSSFRRVFLLSFGDWASNFSKECLYWRKRSSNQSRSKETPYKNMNSPALIFQRQELNALLIKSSLNTDIEDQLSGYRLLVESEQMESFVFSDMLLGNLDVILTFDLKWPIDLFLNEVHLKAYSNMWSFLISLKYTQVSLNSLWKTLRENDSSNQDKKNLSYKPSRDLYQNNQHQEITVWRLRSLMLFWIDTLWSHLQTHVIDVHYENLIDTTTSGNVTSVGKRRSKTPQRKLDFEEIQDAHDKFLINVQRGCLLTSKDCVETMSIILRTCTNFCVLMEKLAEEGQWRTHKRRKTVKTATDIVNNWMTSEEPPLWLPEVKSLEEEFKSSIEAFFSLASSQPPEAKSNGKIDILLMQLDYNKWFSKLSF